MILTSKSLLMERLTNAKTLRDFVVAECLADNGVRAAAKVVIAALCGPVEDLNFTRTDEEVAPEAEPEYTARIAELFLAVNRLRKYNFRKRAATVITE